MVRERLHRRDYMSVIAVTGCLLAAACSDSPPSAPTGPTAAPDAVARLDAQSHGLRLTPVVGDGAGTLNLTSTSSNRGGYVVNVELTVAVHGVSPNTTLYLVRAGDRFLTADQRADGICQRAAAGLFLPVPSSTGGSAASFETSPGGAGAIHMRLQSNDLGEVGARFDAVYRVVDALPPAVPTVDLRTPCFTVTVK